MDGVIEDEVDYRKSQSSEEDDIHPMVSHDQQTPGEASDSDEGEYGYD